MKIGILTHPLNVNYGGLLQAYALQATLMRMGHDVIVINRNPFCSKWRLPHFVIGRIYHKLFHSSDLPIFSNYLTKAKELKIREFTDGFIVRNIHVTKWINTDSELKAYTSKNAFDVFVVGSDQVWRPSYVSNLYANFLDFVGEKERKIAYAASFGVDSWEFSAKQTVRCTELLQRFDAVSVREDSAVILCSKYLHRDDALHVLDPTLLLSKKDYIAIAEQQATPKSQGNLMTYVLDASDEKQSIIERVAQEKCLKPFSVKAKAEYISRAAPSINDCIQPPVEAWIQGFIDAEYVVTDSFHGCVFAIIFNKPFIAIGNHTRGMARFNSLFKMFGLENRLVYSHIDVTAEKINAPIDWERVNALRTELIKKSLSFLKKGLSFNAEFE